MNNNRVLVFNVATSTLSNGENADYVLGQSNFTSNGGTGTQKTFYDPVALAYDVSSGNLFLADKNGNRLLSFPASTGTIANDENANGGLGYYGCTGSSLIFNQSCKDAVSFTPGVLGSESANLVFTVSPDSSSPYTIPFTVSGTTSPAKVSPLSLAFGTVKHPATKSKTVTVTNLANGPIALSESISGSSEFSVSGGTCGASLTGNASCTVEVVFAPTVVGTTTATLSVSDSPDPASPRTVSLTGTGS